MNLVRVATAHGPRHADLQDGQLLWLTGDWALGFRPTGERAALGDTRLLAPVTPSKVVAVARNYAQHAAEMGAEMPDEPRIFLKPSTSVVGPGDAVAIPPRTTRVDPEGELGVVIGRTLTRGTRDTVMDAVFGYTIVNDVTARDFQKKDGIFGRAKGFDTFCPIGPSVVTGLDARDLALQLHVNGELRQDGRTSQMHFDVPTLLVWISSIMTLLPGDVIATGTPSGIAPIVAGDVVRVTIEGIGTLENPVVDREDR